MIPSAYITAWRKYAPWKTNEQVEQDLVICRALISIFSEPVLKDNLALKIKDPDFRSDTETLLRPDINFDIDKAYELVKKEFLGRM
ncbi:hypothetical protein ES708_07135 [subsurface metagenome]